MWMALPGAYDDLKNLLSMALFRLEAFSRDAADKTRAQAVTTAGIIASMPCDGETEVTRWEGEGGAV